MHKKVTKRKHLNLNLMIHLRVHLSVRLRTPLTTHLKKHLRLYFDIYVKMQKLHLTLKLREQFKLQLSFISRCT